MNMILQVFVTFCGKFVFYLGNLIIFATMSEKLLGDLLSGSLFPEGPEEPETSEKKSEPSKLVITKSDVQDVIDRAEGTERLFPMLQPKSVTFSSYQLSAIQQDMLTNIMAELQQNITRELRDIKQVGVNSLSVPLYCKDYVHFNGNQEQFLAEVRKLRQKMFTFRWKMSDFTESPGVRNLFIDPDTGVPRFRPGEVIESSGVMVTMVHVGTESGTVMVDINPWMVPFLLYYGKGVGGTKFFRDVCLSLKGKYSKRLYEMVMDWKTRKSPVEMPVQEFVDMLQLPESYTNGNIRQRVLLPAKEEIEAVDKSVVFKFDFVYRPQNVRVVRKRGRSVPEDESPTKKKANTLVFLVEEAESPEKKRVDVVRSQSLEIYLADIADRQKKAASNAVALFIESIGKKEAILSKFVYYYDRLKLGVCTREEYRNTMLKIVREVSGFDLRSAAHIRNAERAQN